LIELIPQDSTLELIVSADTFGGSYLKSESSYYQGSGDNVLYWSSGSARWEFRGDNNYLWTYNNSANQSAAYIPKTGWVMGDNPYFKGVEIYARKDIDLVKNVFGLGSGYEAAASGDQTGLSVVAILKRGLVHLSSIIAKLPNLISNRIPVDGSGVTQPVSGTVTANTGLTQPLTDTQLRAASVPISQATAANLNATVVGSGSFTAAQSTAANLNATVVGSGSFTAAQPTAANLNATVVGSGSFTAAQATASSLKAQAQILDSAGSLLTYGSTGVAGSPSSDVITVQGASAGTAVNTKILNSSGTAVTYAETGTYGSPSVDVLSVQNPQGVTATITTFTSTTASTSLVAVGLTRKALTVYNSGPGDLYISPTATCTTTNFQLKLSSGDFWECPASQVLLSHTGVFATSGTAYITNLI
jgi:hypothetical protein